VPRRRDRRRSDRLAATTGNDGQLARAEPKTLRHRVLHAAARLSRGQRRGWLRITTSWPWAQAIANAFATIAAISAPG
jgi:Transposase DDE domain group 1